MRELALGTIQNYYEVLVYQQIERALLDTELAEKPGALEDIACLALNQLPARYIRHAIDTAFYLSIEEQRHMVQMVEDAVNVATAYVLEHPREALADELPTGQLSS